MQKHLFYQLISNKFHGLCAKLYCEMISQYDTHRFHCFSKPDISWLIMVWVNGLKLLELKLIYLEANVNDQITYFHKTKHATRFLRHIIFGDIF